MNDFIASVLDNQPKFACNILELFSPDLQRDINEFSTEHIWKSCVQVNINEVIGTMHPDYAGKSWLNLLENGRRMSINLRLLRDNPNYYFETTQKVPQMYFVKVNNKLYIGSDGNHRTCIAKFLYYFSNSKFLSGATLDEYVIGYDFKNQYEKCVEIIRVQRLPISYKVLRTPIKREDVAGEMTDVFALSLMLTNNQFRYDMGIYDMRNFISESTNIFRKFTGKYKQLWRS